MTTTNLYTGDSTGDLTSIEGFGKYNFAYADVLFGTGKTHTAPKGEFRDPKVTSEEYLTYITGLIDNIYDSLADNGTVMIHCDVTAKWLIKSVLDDKFGADHFLNEIIWCYASGGVPKDRFPNKHDTLFWYAKGNSHTYTPQREPYRSVPQTAWGDNYGRAGFNPKGKVVADFWLEVEITDFSWWDISILSTTSGERVGWPTQKPLALLERILKVTTKEGDSVFDPCMGSGTTMVAARNLNRNGVGIDIDERAVQLASERLKEFDNVYTHLSE